MPNSRASIGKLGVIVKLLLSYQAAGSELLWGRRQLRSFVSPQQVRPLMFKTIAQCLALLCLVVASGCSICCAPFDDEYACYGGIMDRTDRVNGRVGSKFIGASMADSAEESSVLMSGEKESTAAHLRQAVMEPDPDRDLQ
ncbi:MAG: hypothetical protein RIS70_3023 [Planctomycetota bacterium]|jgi:hypothetical protein